MVSCASHRRGPARRQNGEMSRVPQAGSGPCLASCHARRQAANGSRPLRRHARRPGRCALDGSGHISTQGKPRPFGCWQGRFCSTSRSSLSCSYGGCTRLDRRYRKPSRRSVNTKHGYRRQQAGPGRRRSARSSESRERKRSADVRKRSADARKPRNRPLGPSGGCTTNRKLWMN